MGIRLHKFLGYGLTDVKTEGYEITDDRLNKESWVFTYEEDPTLDDYFQWLDTRPYQVTLDTLSKNMLDEMELKHRRPRDAFAWEPEFGLPNVLAIQPVTAAKWSRHDDTIDYTEEVWLRDRDCEPRVEVVAGGLWPHLGYMDKRTGKLLDDRSIIPWVRFRNRKRGGGKYGPEEDTERVAHVEDELARMAGLADNQDALENVIPMVPQEIRDIIQFSKVFTSEDIWTQLRPILYVYWA